MGGIEYYAPGTKEKAIYNTGDELYRVYGGSSVKERFWAFTKNPGNQITAIRRGALPPGNTAEYLTKINFSGIVEGEVSVAARLFSQPGGITQVLLSRSRNIIFSPGTALPIGFMPIFPINSLLTALRRWD